MNAYELAERLGAEINLNKLRHPETGEVLAQFEEADLVLTPAGVELAASLEATPAKTTRARKPATVESAPAEAPVQEAPAPEAQSADTPQE